MRFFSALLTVGLLTAPALAQAFPPPPANATLDVDSPMANVSFNGNVADWDRAQTILVGSSGLLAGISFEVYGGGVSSPVNVYGPFNSPSPPTGVPAGSFTLQGQGGGWVETFLDMQSANIVMNAGEYWTIEIIGDPGSCDYKGNATYFYEMWETAGTNTYVASQGPERIGLKTYMVPVPPPVPTLALTGTCPGPGTLDGSNMTPISPVVIAFSFNTGTLVLPPNAAVCPGVSIGITNPRVIASETADGNGNFSLSRNIPVVACGGYLQAVDIATCVTTNVLSI